MKGFYKVDLFDCPPFEMFEVNDCPRARDILDHKRFEPQSMMLWCDLVRNATSVLDIGAQVGVYSLAAAALRKDIAIHAFEPNPDAFARLQIHKTINQFDNINLHREALSNMTGRGFLCWNDKGHISSGARVGTPKRSYLNTITVPIHTITMIDTGLIETLGPRPLIKIDVEGFEDRVISGFGDLLDRRPDILIECFSQENADNINKIVGRMGYYFYKIIEHGSYLMIDGMHAADPKGEDFNFFMTTREI